MARIRTIKPEFPQSESMGNVTRDARLLFVELWTLCDDEGRTRGKSRMLASLLFPYDDDAPDLIDGWLEELEKEGCIIRYSSGGTAYIQLCNWLKHQKIDKPSKSKIPPPIQSSRILANPRESSSMDQGPKDHGVDQGRDQGGDQGNGSAPPDNPATPPKEGKAGKKAKDPEVITAFQEACRTTWDAYSAAYVARYGTEPIRNAKTNTQVQQLVKHLGAEEAPSVAAFYVSHSNAYYVQKCHDFGALVTDYQKLRTEWATGRRVTQTSAMQADRTQTNASSAAEAIRIIKEREGANGH